MINLLAKPLGALLKLVFDLVSKIGVEPAHFSFYAMAIIITTIIFKCILLPIGLSQSKSMKKMKDIQPQLQEIQKKYKSDPKTLQAKTMEVYKKNKYNPFSGCLIMLIQLPIILAFFYVMKDPVKYVFTANPEILSTINKSFFWITDLEKPDPLIWGLPLLSAVTTYLQSVTMGTQNMDAKTASTQKTMNIVLPIMIWWAAKSFPAGLALYWVISNVFQIVQQMISNRALGDIKEE
jgi:YidC/Oxa1 family membrane protein insertase